MAPGSSAGSERKMRAASKIQPEDPPLKYGMRLHRPGVYKNEKPRNGAPQHFETKGLRTTRCGHTHGATPDAHDKGPGDILVTAVKTATVTTCSMKPTKWAQIGPSSIRGSFEEVGKTVPGALTQP